MTSFVDRVWIDGAEYEDHLDVKLDDGLRKLETGAVASIVLGKTHDRDSYLELERIGDLYTVRGSEDSVQRGTFGFCLYRPEEPDGYIETREGPFPLYGTTRSHEYLSEIAKTYFDYGEVPRKTNWIVASEGLAVSKDLVRPESILVKEDRRSLEVFVSESRQAK